MAMILGMLAAPVRSEDYSPGEIVVVVVDSQLTDAFEKVIGSVRSGELVEIEEVNAEKLRLTDGGCLLRNKVMPTNRKAIDRLTTQIKADPNNSRLYAARAAVWVSLLKWEQAIGDANEAIRLDPNPDTYCNRGLAWRMKGEHAKALVDFDEAIRIDPKHARSFRSRAYTWECRGEWDKSISDYSEAIRIGPVSADLYGRRANVWNHEGEHQKAILDYNEALQLNPDCVKYLAWRGLHLSRINEHDKAMVDFNEAIRLYPQRGKPQDLQLWQIYLFRSGTWESHEDFDKAMADLDEIDRIEPQGPWVHGIRGRLWEVMGEDQKAISEYNEEILAAPKDANAYYARGMIHLLLRKQESLDDFCRAIEITQGQTATARLSAIYGCLSAKLLGNEKRAELFLQMFETTRFKQWPAPFAKLLRGELDEPAFLDLAKKKDEWASSHEAEAHCLLGLKYLSEGHPTESATHFQWVKANCPKGSRAYSMSVSELKRLDPATP